MAFINNLQSLTSNLLSTSRSSSSVLDNIAEQSASALTSLGENFSELFAQSQSSHSDASTNTSAESSLALTTANVSDSLGIMQNELLSSLLGYNSGITALASSQDALSNISDFSLDSVKDSLQSNFLGMLQANSMVNSVTQLTETQPSNLLTDLVSYSFNDDGIGLEDAFDVLNVLQHIPVVSSLYQTVTEQENIGAVSKLAGDFLYGGPIGLAYSVLDLAIESYTGTSISDAVAQFDYSSFIFSQSDAEVETEPSTDTDSTTLFFDKNKAVLNIHD